MPRLTHSSSPLSGAEGVGPPAAASECSRELSPKPALVVRSTALPLTTEDLAEAVANFQAVLDILLEWDAKAADQSRRSRRMIERCLDSDVESVAGE